MSKIVPYFGYGANASAEMMEGIVGRVPESRPALLRGFELVIQQAGEVPETVQSILTNNWSQEEISSFRTYAIRHAADKEVRGTLWELQPIERELVDDWEINDGLWYQKTDVVVETAQGSECASTEIIDDPSLTPAIELESGLPVFLNSQERMLEVASNLRAQYLEQRK